jgi:ribosomal protein L11 methyltransferase
VSFRLYRYALPVALEDEAGAALWEVGTLGFQVVEEDGRLRLEAYFSAQGESGPGAGDDPLAGWPGVELLAVEVVEEQDWLAPWRKQARPFDVGRSFRVDPREPEEAAAEAGDDDGSAGRERRLLSLPARAAFGVGSHASTRLAVELLEDVPLAGRTVLDVGTGTGILAFAALHLGAGAATAFDLDPAAVFAARDNAARNGFSFRLFTGRAAALSPPTARFDWALINVVPELILPDMPAVAALLGSGETGGGMVLSGILTEKADEVLAAVGRLGFREHSRAADEEWVALRVERAPATEGDSA